jgi:hypothetical protein
MFFKQFPKVEYDFNRTGIKQNMVDLFRSVRPLPSFLDNFSGYTYYNIKNGERPDIVSGRLYGSSMYYWTFFLINDHLHDGYRAWPMSQEALQEYMANSYNGFAIETNPKVSNNHENSLSGRFRMGETVTGSVSNASGKVTKKIVDLSQLIVQDVTGSFIGSSTGAKELIVGADSEDSVSTYNVYKYIDAPYYYHRTDDALKKPVTNSDQIVGGVSPANLSFVTNRAHLEEENDNNAKIKVIDPGSIDSFVKAYKELLNR